MTADRPQLYLVSPLVYEPEDFAMTLGAALDAARAACVRLQFGDMSRDAARRAIDAAKPVCHARDVALLATDAPALALESGLDGVHLTDGPRQLAAARQALGPDANIGAFCGASKHLGMVAGEAGADYVAFGPITDADGLGEGAPADIELFAWWREMIELPVVAEGGLTLDAAPALGRVADFVALGHANQR